jgi:hypothetical protein
MGGERVKTGGVLATQADPSERGNVAHLWTE